MYEISLVPDVKAELIRKLKIRNLVIMVSVIVALSCGGVFLVLIGIVSGQGIALNNLDTDMTCLSTGSSGKIKCDSSYGTAIMNFENAEEYLTIQNQMNSLASINQNKIKFSRVFNILDTIRPNMEKGDSDTIKISAINANIEDSTLYFDALGYSSNNINYRSLEAFKKNAKLAYYDYGRYMRQDEDGNYVEIPSFCITETQEDGINYGIYHRGTPGCEAPMIEKKKDKSEDESSEDENNESETEQAVEGETKDGEATEEEIEKQSLLKDIKIRRTYNDKKDMTEYMNGKDMLAKEGDEKVKGFYFSSNCLQFDSEGKFDEAATQQTCPLLAEEPYILNSNLGRDENEQLVLSFSAQLTITHDVFLSHNKHMMITGPSRSNVTDSYMQIKDMFTSAAHGMNEEGD